MRTSFLRPQCRLDLLEIWNYLAAKDYATAERFNKEVDAALLQLIEFPGLGHFRPEARNKQLRFWKVSSWMILYRYDDDRMTFLRVIHAHRNLQKLKDNL